MRFESLLDLDVILSVNGTGTTVKFTVTSERDSRVSGGATGTVWPPTTLTLPTRAECPLALTCQFQLPSWRFVTVT